MGFNSTRDYCPLCAAGRAHTYLHCAHSCIVLASVCLWECVLGMHTSCTNKALGVHMPGLCVRLLARAPAPLVSAVRRGTCVGLHARKSPGDPRVQGSPGRVHLVRSCLSPRTQARTHLHMSECTFPSVLSAGRFARVCSGLRAPGQPRWVPCVPRG